MKRKIFLLMSMLLVIISTMYSCDTSERDELRDQVNHLQAIVKSQQKQIIELQKDHDSDETPDTLSYAIKTALKPESNQIIDEDLISDLTDLSSSDKTILDNFKKNYDPNELKNLAPDTIFRLFLYASYTKDFETQYELYEKDESKVLYTKDEFIIFRNESYEVDDYSIFQNTYDFNMSIEDDSAYLSMKSTRGYVDDNYDDLTYGIYLSKEDGIWRVCYLPQK